MKKSVKEMARLLGIWGEDEAARFLAERGYRLLERNCRTKSGELDIIAEDGDFLVFVEVKTRENVQFCDVSFAVDAKKQKKLLRCALEYLQEQGCYDRDCRFDVVTIDTSGKIRDIKLIKNAFQADMYS